MAEFADVPGPRAPRQRLDRRLRDGGLRRQVGDEAPHDLGEVCPLPEGRQFDGEGVQTEHQVFAEKPRLNEFGERPVGRRDDLHVELEVAAAADGPDLAAVEEAQERGLRGERDFGHFIEEQRAAVGLTGEACRAVGARVGEGAPLVAEQFGDEQASPAWRRS